MLALSRKSAAASPALPDKEWIYDIDMDIHIDRDSVMQRVTCHKRRSNCFNSTYWPPYPRAGVREAPSSLRLHPDIDMVIHKDIDTATLRATCGERMSTCFNYTYWALHPRAGVREAPSARLVQPDIYMDIHVDRDTVMLRVVNAWVFV